MWIDLCQSTGDGRCMQALQESTSTEQQFQLLGEQHAHDGTVRHLQEQVLLTAEHRAQGGG